MDELTHPPTDDAHDRRSLQWLARMHFVLGVLTALLATPFVPLALYGYPKVFPPEAQRRQWAVDDRAYQEAIVGAACFSAGVTFASLAVLHGGVIWYLGKCMARQERRKFCVVVTIFNLAYVPLGAALGVYALIVLSRDSVQALFARRERRSSPRPIPS